MYYRFENCEAYTQKDLYIQGNDLKELYNICFKYCKSFSFIIHKDTRNIELLNKYIIKKAALTCNSHHPIDEDENNQIIYCTCNEESKKALLSIANEFFCLVYDWGYFNPEDVTFYREDESVFMSSTAHEGIIELYPRESENVSTIVNKNGWFNRPIIFIDPPNASNNLKRTFSLDVWNLYDIYAYKITNYAAIKSGLFNKYFLLQKVGIGNVCYSGNYQQVMRIIVYDKIYDEIPKNIDIGSGRLLPMHYILPKSPISSLCTLGYAINENHYPQDRLTLVGNIAPKLKWGASDHSAEAFEWSELDNVLIGQYNYWQSKIYYPMGNTFYVNN